MAIRRTIPILLFFMLVIIIGLAACQSKDTEKAVQVPIEKRMAEMTRTAGVE